MADSLKITDPLKEELKASPASIAKTEHWATITHGDPIKDDFRYFLILMWRQLGLPDPTELQLDIAWYLQHHEWNGEIDRLIIMAFRGAAKSWITAAFVLWNLYREPQLKIGVFSGSSRRSVNFVNFCLALIAEWPLIQHLRPKPNQRQSTTSFDVGPSRPDQTPSVFAAGVTAAIVGFRADIIVGDDVETNTNSMTPDMREKLSYGVKEFDAIIKPRGQIIFLGTPQTESSVYNELSKNGYHIVIWPARFPDAKQRKSYGHRLAPYIRHKVENNLHLVGTSTEPTRFTDDDLAGRERAWGKAGFALQYMLDTSLSNVDRYPLKLRDLMVMDLDRRSGPDLVSWGSGDNLKLRDVDPICFDGDGLYNPASVSSTFSSWKMIYAFIDPSGKGADESTLTIGTVHNSTAFVLKQAGWQDGYGEQTLKEMANLIVSYGVRQVMIEEDFGGGMFAKLLEPEVKKAWKRLKKNAEAGTKVAGSTEIISEVAKKVQKELRILEVLEPVLGAHRLVLDRSVLVEDIHQVKRRDGTELRDRYSLMFQMTRLAREKDCLTHDDRVEGLSGLVRMFLDQMGLDPGEQLEKRRERDLEAELKKFEQMIDNVQGRKGSSGRVLRGKLRQGRRR